MERVVLQSSALALNNEIVCTQGHTVQQSEKQLVFLLSVIRYYKIKITGEIYGQIFINSKKVKSKLFTGLCVCCYIFLSGRQMHWKCVGCQACL